MRLDEIAPLTANKATAIQQELERILKMRVEVKRSAGVGYVNYVRLYIPLAADQEHLKFVEKHLDATIERVFNRISPRGVWDENESWDITERTKETEGTGSDMIMVWVRKLQGRPAK